MQWHPTPVLLLGKSRVWRSLVGCSPWGCWESDTTEQLHFHFSLSCIGEGNGNPLQCSCLEHPRDGGAWWAAISGIAQSQTWLKWLSRTWKQPRCPLTDEWIKKLWYMHNGILLSHKKECIWVSSDEVDEPRIYYSEWSESEKDKYHILIHKYGI